MRIDLFTAGIKRRSLDRKPIAYHSVRPIIIHYVRPYMILCDTICYYMVVYGSIYGSI